MFFQIPIYYCNYFLLTLCPTAHTALQTFATNMNFKGTNKISSVLQHVILETIKTPLLWLHQQDTSENRQVPGRSRAGGGDLHIVLNTASLEAACALPLCNLYLNLACHTAVSASLARLWLQALSPPGFQQAEQTIAQTGCPCTPPPLQNYTRKSRTDRVIRGNNALQMTLCRPPLFPKRKQDLYLAQNIQRPRPGLQEKHIFIRTPASRKADDNVINAIPHKQN